ncbi:PAS domain-containing protein [Natronoarchaeum sp. GCM10025703]|uniref:PAS domain-containing protein n=1 Tax=unclassified Natronoarchaeum TaxID=2620183 RepID=UPI003612CC2C
MTANSTDPFEKTDLDPKFEALVEETPDFALFLLDPDGYIISWNRGARQITGYDTEEILGEEVSILAPTDLDERNEPWTAIEEATENDGYRIEDWCRRKDRSSFWASGVIKPIQAEDDSLRGFVVIAQALTERKEHTGNLEAIFDHTVSSTPASDE